MALGPHTHDTKLVPRANTLSNLLHVKPFHANTAQRAHTHAYHAARRIDLYIPHRLSYTPHVARQPIFSRLRHPGYIIRRTPSLHGYPLFHDRASTKRASKATTSPVDIPLTRTALTRLFCFMNNSPKVVYLSHILRQVMTKTKI